jgi:CO/xanthine dehydrogenase Mo-binding subunit
MITHKMKSHAEQVAAVIARQEEHLQREAEALTVKQAEIQAAAEAEALKLAPVKNSLDAINQTFGALVRRHDQLLSPLRVAPFCSVSRKVSLPTLTLWWRGFSMRAAMD